MLYLKRKILIFFILITSVHSVIAQNNINSLSQDKKMEWWREARFGMFIHWGIYSTYGGEYHGIKQKTHGAEWIMNIMKISVTEYVDSAKNFNPTKYDPDAWARMAKEAGMKYLIITTKHHEGFALFKTNASKWNVVDATPYGKDLIEPLVKACHKYNLKLGFYFSHAQDWVNPGGGVGPKKATLGYANPDSTKVDNFVKINNGHWDKAQTTATYDEFLDKVSIPQLKELLTSYGTVDILWWDTPAKTDLKQAQKFEEVLKLQPGIITNNRLKKPYELGDYKTPEGKVPDWAELDGTDWEACMTMNSSWGYQKPKYDTWKSPETLIRTLIDIASKGGNFLLNIGPKPDGTFPQESIDRLSSIGNWMKRYSVAIYGTQASPLKPFDWGRITAKNDKNGTILYLSIFNWPTNGKLKLEGLKSNNTNAKLIGTKSSLKVETDGDNLIITGLPTIAPDKVASVIEIHTSEKMVKEFKSTKKMDSTPVDLK